MHHNRYIILLVVITAAIFSSCSSPKKIAAAYYFKNEKILNDIEVSYKGLYQQQPFALQFTNKNFDAVSIDILTDTIKYVYVFGVNEKDRMNDTLRKYGISINGVSTLVNHMRTIKCTWINNLDYYVDATKHYMIFMSIRQLRWQPPFIPPKYCILTYFPTQQYFDEAGRLLDKRKTRRLRKIKGDIFYRINDKVCYTVSASFR
jgi:hypothetical protein